MATKEEYARAAQAVQSGTATTQQRELNDKMAKNAGPGQPAEARAAKKGELDKYGK